MAHARPARTNPSTPRVAAGAADAACGGERPRKPSGARYACTFTENFDGDQLDRSRWMVQETWFSGMTSGDRDCYVDSPRTVTVGDGAAHISAEKLADPFTCSSPYGDFTTQRIAGTIATRGAFAQTFGRFEFRARFPASTRPGAHAALWLYPADNTYGAWPRSGEIDVAEWLSGDADRVYPAARYAPDPLRPQGSCPLRSPASWHRYGVEWTRHAMRFLLDGRVCLVRHWAPSAPLTTPEPFDQPFYVVITQASGILDNAPTSTTPAHAQLDVDWVRVWR